MKKLKSWLIGLLVIQLLLAAAILLNNQWEAEKNKPKPLLAIDWQEVDKLTIADPNGGITLAKENGSWMLSNAQLPASSTMITTLLHKLQLLQTSWPVATLRSSHQRFDVSEDKFIRHVQLYSKNKLLGELFFGSSPGLHQSHVRSGSDSFVYNVTLDTLDMLPLAQSWLDTELFATHNISALEGSDYNLIKKDGIWRYNDTGPSILIGNSHREKINQNKVNALAEALSTLKISRVAVNPPNLSSDDTTVTTLTVTDDKGSWVYKFFESAGTNHVVQRNDNKLYFKLSEETFNAIAGIRQADLIVVESKNTE